MKEGSPIPRLLASPVAALLSVIAILALAAAARDVPQGLDASRVQEAFGRGTGPFLVLFGLHRLGESFFLWSAIGLLALHLLAVRLRSPIEGFPWRFVPVVLLLALLPLSQRWNHDPDPLRDPVRLSVREASGTRDSFKVEEGSAYRLPGSEGPLLFGTLSSGPWAGEAAPDGTLRLHLPVPIPGASPTFQVSARRPPAIDSWRPAPIPGAPFQGVSLATALLAAFLFVLATARPSPAPADRGARIGLMAAMALILLAPLWFAPEGPCLPLISRTSGATVLFGAMIRSPQDVAPWIGAVPVRFPASTVAPVLRGVLAALAALALFRWVRPSRRTPGPDRPTRAFAVLIGLSGLVLAAMAVLRSPLPLTEDSLSHWLESHVLALVPASWSVLETSLSAPGPWALSWTSLTLLGLALLSLGASLWWIGAPPGRTPGIPLAPFAVALALLALVQAVGCLWTVPSGLLPEAALPSSLLVALLALLGWALPGDSSTRFPTGRTSLAAACLLQLSLVL